jgi:hypothetical protein
MAAEMSGRSAAPPDHTEPPRDAEATARLLHDRDIATREEIKSQIKNYNKTGRRLVTLGVFLEILLGAVTIPLAFAVYSGVRAFIEENPGGLALPGALIGIGVAVAGVFYAAAKMLEAIPGILNARNENAAKLLEALRAVSAEGGDGRASSA